MRHYRGTEVKDVPGVGENSVLCNGTICTMQEKHINFGKSYESSLSCNGSLCIRNLGSFILCLVCSGGCVAMSTIMMDPEMVANWAAQTRPTARFQLILPEKMPLLWTTT